MGGHSFIRRLLTAAAAGLTVAQALNSVTCTADFVDTGAGSTTVAGGAVVVDPGMTTLALKVTRGSGSWGSNGAVTVTAASVLLTPSGGAPTASDTLGFSYATGSCSGAVCTFAVTLAASVQAATYTAITVSAGAVADSADQNAAASVAAPLYVGFAPVFAVSTASTSGASAAGTVGAPLATPSATVYLKTTITAGGAGSGPYTTFNSVAPTLDATKITITNGAGTPVSAASVGLTFASAVTSQPVGTESYFAITMTAVAADTYTLTFASGAVVDGAGRRSAAAAATLAVYVGYAPTFTVASATTGASDDVGATAVFAPNTPAGSIYIAVARGTGTWGAAPTLDASKITAARSDGTPVAMGSVGITISSGAAASYSSSHAYFNVAITAGALAETYSFALAAGAVTDAAGGQSRAGTIAVGSGLAIGFGLTGVAVRLLSTSPDVWSSPLTASAIDPHDTSIFLKLTASGGISSFPTNPSFDVTLVTLKQGSTTQTGGGTAYTLGATARGYTAGDASLYYPITFTSSAAVGTWKMDVAAAAMTTGGNSRIKAYGTTGGAVMTAASNSLVLGYAFTMKVYSAGGADSSALHITPTGAAGSYRLRVTIDTPSVTLSSDPVIDRTKVVVYDANGAVSSAITVGTYQPSSHGAAYFELPLTISAAAAAGVYTFRVASAGFFTYAGASSGPVTTGALGNNAKIGSQTVGVGFSTDIVTAAGASLGGKSLDVSGGAATAYVRLVRTTGSLGTPAFSGSLTGAASSVLLVKLDGAADSTPANNYGFSFTTASPAYALTDATVDFQVTVPSTAAPGTYTIDFAEAAFTTAGCGGTCHSAAEAGAATLRVAYAINTAAAVQLTSGLDSTDLTSHWWAPVSSGLYVRVTVKAAGVGGGAAVIRADAGSEITVDSSKIRFVLTGTTTPASGFGFTGDVKFASSTNYVEVGLDTTAVAPGIYDVLVDAGAFTDGYGVSFQAAAAKVATISVGFGLSFEYWKTDGAAPTPAPVSRAASGEWLAPAAKYAIRVVPDAAARGANVRLNSDSANVPSSLTVSGGGWSTVWSGATTTLVTTGYAVASTAFSTGDTVGRDDYYYVSGGAALTAGAVSGATIAAGAFKDASGTLRNYAATLPAFRAGFAITPTLKVGGTGSSYVGVFNPYLTSFATAPTPINTAANVVLSLPHSSYDSASSTSKTTAVFSSFPLSSTAVTAPSDTTKLAFTLADMHADKVAPGVYDITLPAGTLTDAGGSIKNAELRMRVIVGMPPVLYNAAGTAPATLRSANQTVSVYVTNGRSVLLRQYAGAPGAVSSSAALQDVLYAAVLRNGDAAVDVTKLVGGMDAAFIPSSSLVASTASNDAGAAPLYLHYALDITGLTDGTDYYTLTRKMAGASSPTTSLLDAAGAAETSWPNVAIIVDRTSPVGKDARVTGSTPYLGAAATVSIPVDAMFTDAVSPAGAVTVTAAAADDMHGFTLTPGAQGTAALSALSVLGPEGDVTFTLTATDEAGNAATARLTLTLYAKRKPVLSVADSTRLVYTTGVLKTGAAQAVSGALTLKVIATFPEAIKAGTVVGSDLTVIDTTTGLAPTGMTKSEPVSSANGRVWTYTIALQTSSPSAGEGRKLSFVMASAAGQTAAKSLATDTSDAVYAVMDNSAPAASPVTSSFSAVVGIPFFAVIPVAMHSDRQGIAGSGATTANQYVTADDNIDIVSSTLDVSVGLALTPGKAGAAYVSGTATLVPPSGFVTFTITARDEAGNAVSSGTFKVPVVTQAAAGYNPNPAGTPVPPTLTFDVTTARYSDTVARPTLTLSSSASWTSQDAGNANAAVKVDAVYVYLVTPDHGATGEKVAGSASGVTTGTVLATMGSIGNNGVAVEVFNRLSAAAEATVTASDVTNYLRSLAYSTLSYAPSSGTRVVHVVVVRDGYVVGYVNKKVTVESADAAPTLLPGAVTSVTFTEGSAAGVPVAPTVSITDYDDAMMTKAAFAIKRTGDGTTFGGCDASRDALYLPADYMAPATPRMEASWDAASCTLSLAPAGSVAALPLGDFTAAMRAVKYRNLNARDPTNGVTTVVGRTRKVDITVTDAASGGLVSSSLSSAPITNTVVMSIVDDAATVDLRTAYAAGGMFYETDANANWGTYTDPATGVKHRVRKFSLIVDPAVTTTTTYFVSFDLTKQADRSFGALGAILDVDTLEPVSSGVNIGFAATSPPSGVAVAPVLSGSDAAGPFYVSAHGGAKSRLPITITNPSLGSIAGELKVTMTYGANGPAVPFFVDIRQLGCTLKVTGSADVDLTKVYPSAAACAAALASDPAVVTTVSSPASPATVAPASFATLSSAALLKAAALIAAGSATSDAVTAAAAERGAARGVYAVTVPAASWSTTTGTLPLSALPLDATTTALLPSVKSTESLDASVSLHLGPACQAFSKPVKVCVLVGDTASGYTRNLRFASQVDCGDATKGYGAFEPATSQTFSPISGELCGYTTHFSVAAVVTAAVAGTPVVAKYANMGGSCPNDCSGHGYCRAEGKCVCFAGYSGYDCAARSCPVAQSWDSADGVIHKQVECGHRGICDKASGKCNCFDGFTGAACDRALCPHSCSGHGRCLMLNELAGPQSAGYNGWEGQRLQVCKCDGGYTGPDCSQRVCPFGDDPETSCSATTKQVQTLTLDFGTLPSSLSGTLPASLYDIDEVVLTFTAPDGSNYTTNAIRDIFDPANGGAANLRAALVALPGFAINAVTVTGALAADSTSVSYAITFDGGLLSPIAPRLSVAPNTVPGNQALLVCPRNIDGSMGCVGAGCRPLFQQARLFDAQGTAGITLNETAILRQPAAVPSSGFDETTAAQWGVDVYVAVAQNGATGEWTYSVTSDIYGATGLGASIATTPIPPGALRLGVPLVYGLVVDFPDTPAATAGRGARFSWRLPSCAVAQTQAADADYELKECSGRGVCDRKAGQCKCFGGYAGGSCSQQTVIV